MQRFMVVSRHIAAGALSTAQPATNDATAYVTGFAAIEVVIRSITSIANQNQPGR
jgi:hypothetical protein